MDKNLHALAVPSAPLLLSDMGVLSGLFPSSVILLQIFSSLTAKIMLLVGRCTLFPYILSQLIQHHYFFFKYATTPKTVMLLCEQLQL